MSAPPPSAHACGRTTAGTALRTWLTAVLTASLLSALALPGARAGDKTDHADHEQARAAVQAGEVLPLPTLLHQLQRTHPGQVLELALEREDGLWLYEVKLLQVNGRLLKLELDASTGRVLTVKREKDRSSDSKGKTSNGASK